MAGADEAALREAVEKAAAGGDAGGLALEYRRGHEMSGTTALSVSDGVRYSLRAVDRSGEVLHDGSGTLSVETARRLWSAVARHGLAVPSSTRALGDGEVPTSIVVAVDGRRREADVWARDGRDIEAFVAFQAEIGALLAEVSGGAVTR